jgi:hypothetical protein
MATAITYSTTGRKRDLRTVVVEDVRQSVVILPTGRLDVTMAKLLHGTTCRCEFWVEALGTDPGSDDFVIPADQVVAVREIAIAVKIARHS